MLVWIIRALLAALVLRLLTGFVTSMLSQGPGAARRTVGGPGRTRRVEKATALQRDPVCGTYVVPTRAVTTTTGGTTTYFCSDGCRQAYRGA